MPGVETYMAGRAWRTVAAASTGGLLALALVTASGAGAEFQVPAAPAVAVPAPPPPARAATALDDPRPVLAAVRAAVHRVSSQAAIGLVVADRTTGQTVLADGANRQFRSASLVKLLIAVQALGSTTPTAAALDPVLANRVERMLRDSNDNDASVLWDELGGADLVLRSARLLGLRGAGVPDLAGRWGNTLLTANDLLGVYHHLLDRMPLGGLALSTMRAAPRVAADGFDQHFGIPTAFAGQPWVVKQGWGASSQDVFVHSTGLVGPGDRYVVILLTAHPPGTSFRTGASAVTAGLSALAPVLPMR